MLTASFIFGSRELYDFVDHNQDVRMMRTEVTNDPGRIAHQPIMTSVNGALQVDLSRAGERVPGPRPHLLRIRREHRLHRGCPAFTGRARLHRTAVVASQGRPVDDRPAHQRTRDVVPAFGHRDRTGAGHGVREHRDRPGPPDHQQLRPPRSPRQSVGRLSGRGRCPRSPRSRAWCRSCAPDSSGRGSWRSRSPRSVPSRRPTRR